MDDPLSGANFKTLNRALRCGVRFVFDRGRRGSITPFVLELLTLPFERFLQERRLLMIFKILRFHHYPRYLKPMLERGTSRRLLLTPELSSSWSYKCPIRVAITKWNKVDDSLSWTAGRDVMCDWWVDKLRIVLLRRHVIYIFKFLVRL